MALTKVSGDFIDAGSITQGHLHSSHGITTTHIAEGDKLFFTNARVDSRIGSLSSSDLSEGTNLYYTDARARAAISGTGSLSYNSTTGVMSFTMPAQNTSNITEGSNLYYTDARADARIAAADTGDLSEGTNLYYTDARADARITAASTSDLSEGTNLYYTDARADARITAADTDSLSEGSTNLYYTDARADARVALIVDSSPEALNTLNELAAALNDDADFSTTITTSIATKMPLAGGTFSGNTTAPKVIVSGSTNAYATAPVVYFDSTSTANAGIRDWAIGPADDTYGNFHIFVGASTGADPVGNAGRVLTITNAGNATFVGTITAAGTITATGGNSTQWNTAYSWGDHASGGYAADNTVMKLTGNQTITGTKTFYNNSIVISGTHGTISFMDTTSGEDNFYLHANSNNFYVLADRDGTDSIDGGYETPHPLQLEGDTNTAYVFGNRILTTADEGSGNGIDADTLDGLNSGQNGANIVLRTHSNGYLYINNWIHPANGTGLFYDAGVHFYESGNNMYSNTGLSSANQGYLWGASNDGKGGLTEKIFNNQGNNHSTYTDFNNTDLRAGVNYIQQGTNGPTGTTSDQWYSMRLGLGYDYGTQKGGTGDYFSEIAWSRQAQGGHGYLYARDQENGTIGSWRKMSAGNADTLDGVDSSQFLRADVADTATMPISFTGGHGGITITNTSILSAATSAWTGNPGANGKIQYHSNRWYIVSDSSSNRIVQFRRDGSDKSYIDNNGKFIGTASSADNADTVDSLHASSFLRSDAANGGVRISAGDGNSLRFWDSTNYMIYMSSAGNSTYGGRVNGETSSDYNMYFKMTSGTNRGFVFRNNTNNVVGIDSAGNGRFEGDVIAYASSDRRYKDNLVTIGNATEKVKQLSGYEFTWNNKQTVYPENTKDIGVVAQEVEKVLPELVTTRESGYKAVKYDKLTVLLIEAVKEQQKQIEELKDLVGSLIKKS